ncbi:hypothetical protein [Solidesulfovibrio sp.]|jgi:TPR repeat protein|uniref:tetratricopeptide repeat protein n=1 Tax=Solidesulfovibrio sp. TaxID=2910990 RepID=UPI000EB99433|nr:hypothetical protein [Solidesulfovibrio sp.]MEA5088469.1 hypothetical protein [Solidesulfovibrio sp.]HCR12965.1 hypothetical protein [Desulfovibrio sp.]HML60094.1 hypothetical protein [Solidesulfovibrio sp.]
MLRIISRPAASLAVVCLFFLATPSARAETTASPDPDAVVQDFAAPETFDAVLAKAQAGDAKAQCALGVAYINGTRAPQNFGQGLHWLHRSSEAGYGYARYVLADLYSRGYGGVPVSDAQAYYFASLAAASSSLPEKFREKAVKLRNASARRLSPAELTGLQAKAALAPLDAAAGN